jgi:hypothetical protein
MNDSTAPAPTVSPVEVPQPPVPAKPVVAAAAGEVPLIVKLEHAVVSVLIRELGNNAMMHNLRGRLMDALKSVK